MDIVGKAKEFVVLNSDDGPTTAFLIDVPHGHAVLMPMRH